jgi:hypothetical protein
VTVRFTVVGDTSRSRGFFMEIKPCSEILWEQDDKRNGLARRVRVNDAKKMLPQSKYTGAGTAASRLHRSGRVHAFGLFVVVGHTFGVREDDSC